MSEKRCYTVQELQEILGVSRPTIYNLLKKKEFRWIQLDGGKYRIPMLCERLAGKTGILLKNTHYNYKPKNMNSAYLLLFRNFPGVVL